MAGSAMKNETLQRLMSSEAPQCEDWVVKEIMYEPITADEFWRSQLDGVTREESDEQFIAAAQQTKWFQKMPMRMQIALLMHTYRRHSAPVTREFILNKLPKLTPNKDGSGLPEGNVAYHVIGHARQICEGLMSPANREKSMIKEIAELMYKRRRQCEVFTRDLVKDFLPGIESYAKFDGKYVTYKMIGQARMEF